MTSTKSTVQVSDMTTDTVTSKKDTQVEGLEQDKYKDLMVKIDEMSKQLKGLSNYVKELRKENLQLVKELAKQEEELLSKRDPKAYATRKKQPWVGVLDVKVNEKNVRNGFFELDWNNEFIEQLIDAGYSGETNEEIVNGWFRTIAMQILEEEGLDTQREIGYINVKPIDKDKSEVS